ncbi:MAG: DUF4160 domain-containing protein [Candidatus Latescibacterota bacterium]
MMWSGALPQVRLRAQIDKRRKCFVLQAMLGLPFLIGAHRLCLVTIQEKRNVPIISRFFGILIRMFYDDHTPPHLHAEYQGKKAVFDFHENILKGDIASRTATKLVREWIDVHYGELEVDW